MRKDRRYSSLFEQYAKPFGKKLLHNGLLLLAILLAWKTAWLGIVPDLFPSAVKEGIVLGEISYLIAAKLTLGSAFFLWCVKVVATKERQ